ncbi:family 7 glycoside hydrolase [Melampsora americana]|nr:family 7 glycoside hydrolase [Melampsora americana]
MYILRSGALTLLFASSSRAQQAGTMNPEVHPKLTVQQCAKQGGCKNLDLSITLDANWRWLRKTTDSGSSNCYTGQTWDASVCSDPQKCAESCALEGASYVDTYGIQTDGSSLSMKFVTNGPYSKNVGSRVYLMADESKYQMFKLKNQEFAFDVDASKLPCGLNGALYFSEMAEDGGMGKFPGNKAGAKYGTGYCDAQCPHDIKFIGGKANVEGWKSSATDVNAGTGKFGACCDEMDIWEANSISQAFTVHPCSAPGFTACEGAQCGDDPDNRHGGICDKDGCDFASYRLGAKDFYGPGKKVDSSKKVTVVTQFITTDKTAKGDLKEIRRLYVQDGKVIANSKTNVPKLPTADSITDGFCKAVKTIFGDQNDFSKKGGLKSMGESMDRGHVLVMSIWDDHSPAAMDWLSGDYPHDKPAGTPGVDRGTCEKGSGDPKLVESKYADATVVYSNIKFGDIDSTYTTEKKTRRRRSIPV